MNIIYFNGKNSLQKTKKYYLHVKILYEGDFINGNKEGFGKYILEDSKYYIVLCKW